ncbi:MarR family transcriptional regulator [Candidatus Magnetobacterium bavaricum]|uniref:MarR family transcriptional regulator n=1 Tax=Candidatus Magnetobacterium bavaricum TaxID=29290 RepID=A0A0F3GKE2_9BACT|nr:MarR family transcriptional regulator [Candidatus Magnetobacterium bavaricum]
MTGINLFLTLYVLYVIVHEMNEYITLRLLDEIEKESEITQRLLSDRLVLDIGPVNTYIKRLCQNGYVKPTTLPRNRFKYIINPNDFVEKVRLTYSYMLHSIIYFREVRELIEHTYAKMADYGIRNIVLLGDGEVDEMCYISTHGLPIKIIGILFKKHGREVAEK